MQRLLVSVRGRNEVVEAAKGEANIFDVEYPAYSVGIRYPLNVYTINTNEIYYA